ncbi:substrate-binding domain-containing protein [Amycolatopsis regifaucium]|uniref:Sugar ABC transporter substrate-binding protein n=1 Tax=Amycolatopsis regifaucium TaxID=546365 RepID=A0A154MAK6_9PSEU|nr:substrate-binding domain-containing protein [Amycolatopsis regifaucium]KZB81320.1 sugar ABC transporter substrate-binding protein [Amycolatopsis regifaucium]OKA04586.1 sugar ABC transporter substrate-binding protein [Amycolatopsis regifaucium]SFH34573.1 monosaccharide ABC transporter substrate-binding protein, CUT2 family [Amycolatopsis regifaucium]
MSHRFKAVLVAAAGLLLLSACTGPKAEEKPAEGAGPASTQPSGPLRVAVISHGTAGDAFWNVVKNGAEEAGRQLDVQVEYNSDGDPGNQAKLIDNAVAQRVGGLVVSMANPEALKTSIENAVRAGIPVITINSGEDKSAGYGALTHVGQNETIAGEEAGKKFKELGKKKLLCVVHEAGNVGQAQRCDGAKTGFADDVQTLQVDISNPTDAESRIRGAVRTDSSLDAVLTLNSQVAARAVSAIKAVGSKAQVGTFDLNTDVVGAIKAGDVVFAVDQQQYEQGYLPVQFLKLYRDNANVVGGGKPVLTGPDLVDKSTVDTVGQYVQRGTR